MVVTFLESGGAVRDPDLGRELADLIADPETRESALEFVEASRDIQWNDHP